MKRIAAALALLLLAAPAFAQIEERTTLHCITPIPEGAKVEYKWLVTAGSKLTLTPSESGRSAASSGNGEVTLKLTIDDKVTWYEYSIGDSPAPVPVVETLRDLVPDKTTAAVLQDHYATWPQVVPTFAEPRIFSSAEKSWRATKNFPGLEKFYAEVDRRLNIAVAIDPWQESISKELLAIAGELKSSDTPPVVKPDDPKPVEPTQIVTAATYVYDYPAMAVPPGVSTGLNRLNRERNIRATLFEDGTRDGDGDVPDQYKVALDAAIKAGLPAFVVQAGNKVLAVVKDPRTEAAILEAVKDR